MSKIVEITLDFETYYNKKKGYKLKHGNSGLTIEEYVRNPKFEIIGLAVKEYNRPAKWLAPHEIQYWIDYVAGAYGWDNVRVIAHNGRFDMAILGWIYNVYPYQVADTMLMSRACQLWDGHSLDNVTKQLRERYRWGVVKNERGETTWGVFDLEDLPDTLDKGEEVHNADGKHLMDFTDEEYDAYGDYAMDDVNLTYSAYKWFMTQRKFPEKEIDVMTLTIEMFTYPVIELHKPVLLEVEKEVNGKRQALLDKVGATVEDLRSDANFAKMLQNLGVTPPMKLNAKGEKKYAFAKKDLAFLKLLEHEDPNVVALVEARLGNKSSQAVTRVRSLLELADRGLMPIPLEYYAAHTGRWGGSDSVNLQNFNRNQLVTSDTPTGTKVFYADKADAVVEVLPNGNVHLARAGVVKNEEELLHVMGLRDALKAPKGKKLVVFDLSQVECVSGDGFVLTNNGLKKICEISTSDLVFDGVEYVTHDGVMFKGVKDVIEYCGVVGTPDHIVYTRSGEPITLDQAAFSKAELCTGGAEWDKVWEMGGFKQTDTINDTDDQSLVSMPMWFGASSCDKRPKKRKIHRLSKVWERTRESLRRLTRETSQSVASEIQCVAGACESEQVHQQNLCERGEQVYKLRRICPLYVEHRSERRLHGVGARPYRHKRSLRKGKSTFRNKIAKRTNTQVQRYGGVQWGFNVSVNVRPAVCAELSLRHGEQKNTQGLNTRSDYIRERTTQTRAVGVQRCKNDPNTIRSQIQQRKGAVQPLNERDSNTRFTELGNVIVGTIPVYDIINCGPRHRFCYNGVIVSNCRANAWEWGEQWVLDALVSGKDIYKVTAASTYGVAYDDVTKSQRFVGKSQQLGLGYGAGVNGLKAVMGKRCEEFTDDELQGFVNAYRAAAPNIVRGWKQCKMALGAMVSGVQIQFCKDDILYTDGERIALPNGLHLTYRDIHTRPGEMGNEFWFWGKNKQTKKPDWEKTFAGKIDENCIAEDTEVLTDRGWVKIQDVKLTDKVHDGVEFVTHKGILFKAVKDCVKLDGVYMTADHDVLTNDGWKQAGLLLSERSTSSIQRLDRLTLWELSYDSESEHSKDTEDSEQEKLRKKVYDILDCGKRNRFVVRGDTEPFIVHNCTQALCRIIMADIMLAIREDFRKREWTRDDAHICLTVHDEVIVCCKDELAEEVSEIMQYQMKKPRDWYSDLPLDCDGDIAQRYGCAK